MAAFQPACAVARPPPAGSRKENWWKALETARRQRGAGAGLIGSTEDMMLSWRGIGALAGALLAFFAAAEYEKRSRPGPAGEPLTRRTLAFSDVTARVWLPSWGKLKNYPGETNQFRFVFSDGRARDILLRRKAFANLKAKGRWGRKRLDNGFTLKYAVTKMNAGTGGVISSLTGTLRRDGLELGVKCFDQNERREPDATWCIKYLHSLTVGL
jgi:hypothetical protein